MSRIISMAFVVAGVFAGLLFNKSLDICVEKIREWYFETFLTLKHKNLYTLEELSEYNGEIKPEIFMAFMGIVYDVTGSSKHYGKNSPYHYFAGKDATRSFITGNFKDESDLKDQILDLNCDELLGLMTWQKTIKEKYRLVGFVMGRYYDRHVQETRYHVQCLDKMNRCLMQRELAKEEDRQFPPCNVAWNAEEGTRVWCTKTSGGIKRGWTGVPRQLFTPGSEKSRCVCVNETTEAMGMLKEYDNCSNTSTSCFVAQD